MFSAKTDKEGMSNLFEQKLTISTKCEVSVKQCLINVRQPST